MGEQRNQDKARQRDAGGESWMDRHLWQIQPVRDVLLVAALFGLVWIGHTARVVTVPLLVALLLAYLFEPVVRWLSSRSWVSRQGAASAVLAFLVFLVVVPVSVGVGVAAAQGVGLVGSVARTAESTLVVVRSATEVRQALPEVYVTVGQYEGRPFLTVPDVAAAQAELTAKAERAEQEAQSAERLAKEAEGKEGDAGGQEAGEQQPVVALRARADERRREAERLRVKLTTAVKAPERLAELKTSFDTLPTPVRALVISYLDHGIGITETAHERRKRGGSERDDDSMGLVEQGLSWVQANARSIATQAVGTGVGAAATLGKSVLGAGKLLLGALLTGFFFYFISTGYPQVLAFGKKLLPEKNQGRLLDLISKMDGVVAGFVRGRLLIAVIQMVTYTVLFWIAGVPAPLIVGVIVAVASMVPFAGFIGIPIGIIGLALTADAHMGVRSAWWWILGAPVVVFMLGQVLDDYVLTPMIQGKSTGMDAPTILFASLAGGALLGVYGVLLAIPLAACVKILLREVAWPRFKAWAEGKQKDFLPFG